MANGYIFIAALTVLIFISNVQSFELDSINSINDHKHANQFLQGRKLFDKFIKTFNKTYNNDWHREERFQIFKNNLNKIELLNRQEQGTAKYGITQFTDLTTEEFNKHLGVKPELRNEDEYNSHRIAVNLDHIDLPETFDWRDKGAVTEVKDQGFCGSCWAFSVTGNIEGQNKIKKGQLISLSEQELVDCDKKDEGCGGGYMTNAYQSVKELGGLETEKDYPYAGYLSEGCVYNKSLAKVTIDSYVVLPTNETQIAQWLVEHGPISIGLNAGAMQFYLRGISHPYKFTCSPKKINHGVLIVGFGKGTSKWSKKELPYWIIKNSWGGSWGRKGYYLLYRGDNSCGVNSMATSAVIN